MLVFQKWPLYEADGNPSENGAPAIPDFFTKDDATPPVEDGNEIPGIREDAEPEVDIWDGFDGADTYKGKTLVEVATMHRNADKLIGTKESERIQAVERAKQLEQELAALKAAPAAPTKMPNPSDDPEGFQKWLEARDAQVAKQQQQEVLAAQQRAKIDAAGSKLGLNADQITQRLGFWEKEENFTPEFMLLAPVFMEALASAKSEGAAGFAEAVSRIQKDVGTTLGRGLSGDGPEDSVESLMTKVSSLQAQGKHREADALMRKFYG